MAEILKPCPLCGSTNLKHYARDYRGNPLKRAVVRCESCGCEVDALSDNAVLLYEKYEWPDARKVITEQAMGRVVEKWNRRAESACRPEVCDDGAGAWGGLLLGVRLQVRRSIRKARGARAHGGKARHHAAILPRLRREGGDGR